MGFRGKKRNIWDWGIDKGEEGTKGRGAKRKERHIGGEGEAEEERGKRGRR